MKQILIFLHVSSFRLTHFKSMFHFISALSNNHCNSAQKLSKFGVFLVRIFPYLFQIWENTDQKICEFGHFLGSTATVEF